MFNKEGYDTLDIKASIIEKEIENIQVAVDALVEGWDEIEYMVSLTQDNLKGLYAIEIIDALNTFKSEQYDKALGEIMVILKYLKNYREMLRVGSNRVMFQTQDYVRVVPKRMIELESEAEQLISVYTSRVLADGGVYAKANSRKRELERIIVAKISTIPPQDASEEKRLLRILNSNLSIYESFDNNISGNLSKTNTLPLELEEAHKVFKASFDNSKVIYEGIDYEKYKHDQFMENYFDFYMDVEHKVLNIGSYYPGLLGTGCDGVNTILYFIEGLGGEDTFDDAFFSFAGVLPGFKGTIKGGVEEGMDGLIKGLKNDLKKGLEEGVNLKKIFKNTSIEEQINDFAYSVELLVAEIMYNVNEEEDIKLETPTKIGATGVVGILSIIAAGVL